MVDWVTGSGTYGQMDHLQQNAWSSGILQFHRGFLVSGAVVCILSHGLDTALIGEWETARQASLGNMGFYICKIQHALHLYSKQGG